MRPLERALAAQQGAHRVAQRCGKVRAGPDPPPPPPRKDRKKAMLAFDPMSSACGMHIASCAKTNFNTSSRGPKMPYALVPRCVAPPPHIHTRHDSVTLGDDAALIDRSPSYPRTIAPSYILIS